MSILLAPEEYIEQEFFFGAMRERLNEYATQELLRNVKFEILSNTKLPLAVDFMATEMMHRGTMGSAMARLPHYFSPYQVFIITEAEKEEGRFDFRVGLEILQALAKYYSTIELIPEYSEFDFRDRTDGIPINLSYTEGRGLKGPSHFITPQGIFLFEIEVISRNRLDYESGLAAMAEDPIFHPDFKEWVRIVGRQLGCVDLAEMIYVRSQYYLDRGGDAAGKSILFGRKEGQIALANRRKDMGFLFASLQRQLGYPQAPRTMFTESEETKRILLEHRLDLLETRLRLLEEEKAGGINLNNFYAKPS